MQECDSNPWIHDVLDQVRASNVESNYKEKEGILYYRDRLCVGPTLELHAKHPGRTPQLSYWWSLRLLLYPPSRETTFLLERYEQVCQGICGPMSNLQTGQSIHVETHWLAATPTNSGGRMRGSEHRFRDWSSSSKGSISYCGSG